VEPAAPILRSSGGSLLFTEIGLGPGLSLHPKSYLLRVLLRPFTIKEDETGVGQPNRTATPQRFDTRGVLPYRKARLSAHKTRL